MSVVSEIREFNRRWTQVLGLLERGLLDTEFSLPEARVIFELAQRPTWERAELRNRLDVDASFLTRILKGLEQKGLVSSAPSESDGRAIDLALTHAGRAAFSELDGRSTRQIEDLIRPLSDDMRATLTESMALISNLVVARDDREVTYRPFGPGDLGWVVQRHGAIYFDEYGWDADFECLVAEIVADYHAGHRPRRENAWIAEVDGARAGCVFCCEKDTDTAQLRLLLVEPWARGLGIGTALVERCLDFARSAGYSRMMLWTNDVLVSARKIYQAAGFQLVTEEQHHSFGHDLVGQNWELDLRR